MSRSCFDGRYVIKNKVSFDDLVVGNQYYTECGIWEGVTTYVGAYQVGNRIKYRFTYGPLFNVDNQFGHFSTKSAIKVYEIEKRG